MPGIREVDTLTVSAAKRRERGVEGLELGRNAIVEHQLIIACWTAPLVEPAGAQPHIGADFQFVRAHEDVARNVGQVSVDLSSL